MAQPKLEKREPAEVQEGLRPTEPTREPSTVETQIISPSSAIKPELELPTVTTQETKPVIVPTIEQTRDPFLIEIKNELAKGLFEMFKVLPDDLQQEFRMEGERVASIIYEKLSTHDDIDHEIVELIAKWLLMIPDINLAFVQQEAKIKADSIIRLGKK